MPVSANRYLNQSIVKVPVMTNVISPESWGIWHLLITYRVPVAELGIWCDLFDNLKRILELSTATTIPISQVKIVSEFQIKITQLVSGKAKNQNSTLSLSPSFLQHAKGRLRSNLIGRIYHCRGANAKKY